MSSVVNQVASCTYNLFFEKPITNEDVIYLNSLFSNCNSIKQIYMNDGIDIDSIKIIKYLLEISSNTIDSEVEKYILGTNTFVKDLCEISYQNPDTWQISYEKKDKNYKVTSIPKCRKMINLCDIIRSRINNYSSCEKVIYIYNYLKKYKIGDVLDDSIPEIIDSTICSDNGLNMLFTYLLKDNGILSYIVHFKGYSVSMVYIDDSKYNIDGYYFFVPKDSINKDIECFTLNQIKAKSSSLIESLKCSYKESIQIFNLFNLKYNINYFNELESTFNNKYYNIYTKLHNSKEIDSSVLNSIINNVINYNVNSKVFKTKKV